MAEYDVVANVSALSMADIEFGTRQNERFETIMNLFPLAVGKNASRKERNDRNLETTTLIYGEICFDAYARTFGKIKRIYGLPNAHHSGPNGVMQSPGGNFIDLGSGSGKAVIAAALLHPFTCCRGVEILEGLYTLSNEIASSYENDLRNRHDPIVPIQFFHGDFTDFSATVDWTNADVVFANSTCFDDKLMKKIAFCCQFLKPGAFIITFTKSLPVLDYSAPRPFETLEYELLNMSWGSATVYIQQRVANCNVTDDKLLTGALVEDAVIDKAKKAIRDHDDDDEFANE